MPLRYFGKYHIQLSPALVLVVTLDLALNSPSDRDGTLSNSLRFRVINMVFFFEVLLTFDKAWLYFVPSFISFHLVSSPEVSLVCTQRNSRWGCTNFLGAVWFSGFGSQHPAQAGILVTLIRVHRQVVLPAE